MSEENRTENINTENDYYYHANEPDENEYRLSDEELRARINARRRKTNRRRTLKKTRTVVLLIIVFAMLFTMCGKDIVRLKAENLALKKQQEELTAERDRLRKELKETSNEEYIQDQARKQLRLLNEGEILFLFGEDE